MFIHEYKLDGKQAQYTAIDEAIRIVQFIEKARVCTIGLMETGTPASV